MYKIMSLRIKDQKSSQKRKKTKTSLLVKISIKRYWTIKSQVKDTIKQNHNKSISSKIIEGIYKIHQDANLLIQSFHHLPLPTISPLHLTYYIHQPPLIHPPDSPPFVVYHINKPLMETS